MAKKAKAEKPKAKKPMKYTATDGTLFVELKSGESGYTVTSPFVPGFVTVVKTLEKAFAAARDAVSEREEVGREQATPEPREANATKPPKPKKKAKRTRAARG